METLKKLNENEIEMRSDNGFFFVGCIDSVIMDYSFIDEEICYKNELSYSVTLKGKELFIVDTLPSYEVQCRGNINGYFIPSGMSAFCIIPTEICNPYLLEVSKEEGLLIKSEVIKVKYSNKSIFISYENKNIEIILDNEIPPYDLERL